MKKLLISSIVAIALIGTPAFAADIAVKAPPPPPAPVYNWTGWYVGGNVGYSWGDANTDLRGNGTVTSFGPPGLGLAPVSFPFAFGGPSNTTRLNGVIGGVQVGYNYQFSSNAVLGFEADFQGAGERGSGTFTDPFSGLGCFVQPGGVCAGTVPVIGTAITGYQANIDWFGTVRGRLGILVGDQLLVYGTGGLAYGQVNFGQCES